MFDTMREETVEAAEWGPQFLALDEAVAERYLGYSEMDIIEALAMEYSVDETVAMLRERYRERDESDGITYLGREAARIMNPTPVGKPAAEPEEDEQEA